MKGRQELERHLQKNEVVGKKDGCLRKKRVHPIGTYRFACDAANGEKGKPGTWGDVERTARLKNKNVKSTVFLHGERNRQPSPPCGAAESIGKRGPEGKLVRSNQWKEARAKGTKDPDAGLRKNRTALWRNS